MNTAPKPATSGHMFQMGFYSKYFDLDSDTFFRKLKKSMNPLELSFMLSGDDAVLGDETTELYGFFWITGTLVFLVFVSSTGSNILASWLDDSKEAKYQYSFDLLTITSALFYGYTVAMPTLLFVVTSFVFHFEKRLSLVKLISLYGYTNVLWFPITLINFVLVGLVGKNHRLATNLLEWIIVLLSGVVTGMSNLVKIAPMVKENCMVVTNESTMPLRKRYYTIIGLTALIHLGFSVLVKVVFFGIKA